LPSPWIALLRVAVRAHSGQAGGIARTPCSPGCWAGLLGRSALYGVLAEVEGLGDEAGEQSSSDPGDSPVCEILVREITGTR